MRKGEVLIIVGGAGDIGQAIALAATAAGVQVIIWDYHIADDAHYNHDPLIEYMQLDCADAVAVAAALLDVQQKYKRVDAMIAAAGKLFLSAVEDINSNDLEACFSANVYANFYPLQAVNKIMQQQKYGRMLVLSSDQARLGRSAGAAYAMTKAALLQLPAVITAETQGGADIRINTLLLGTVAGTAMTEQAASYFAADNSSTLEGIKLDFTEEIPTKQLVDKRRLAKWALRLCDKEATDFAAAVFSMDGGLTAVR